MIGTKLLIGGQQYLPKWKCVAAWLFRGIELALNEKNRFLPTENVNFEKPAASASASAAAASN